MEEEVETGDAIQEEEDRRDVRDEDMRRPENVHIAAIAEMSKNSSGTYCYYFHPFHWISVYP